MAIMLERNVIRKLFVPLALRGPFLQPITQYIWLQHFREYSSDVRGVTHPSFWAGLIPKPFRKSVVIPDKAKKPKPKEWNPATFYIIMFLLIGSMPVQMIALRNEFAAFSRRADARIALLREAIEKVQKGEKVDVEGLLGTGDSMEEKDWEILLQEIEKKDQLVPKEIENNSQIWNPARKNRKRDAPLFNNNPSTTKVGDQTTAIDTADQESCQQKRKSNSPPRFY